MTTNATSHLSFIKSLPSLPLLRTPSTPPDTALKQLAFLLSFSRGKPPSHKPSVDNTSITNEAPMEATMVMDQELHSRMKGDVIASYRLFDVRAIGGSWKHKSIGD